MIEKFEIKLKKLKLAKYHCISSTSHQIFYMFHTSARYFKCFTCYTCRPVNFYCQIRYTEWKISRTIHKMSGTSRSWCCKFSRSCHKVTSWYRLEYCILQMIKLRPRDQYGRDLHGAAAGNKSIYPLARFDSYAAHSINLLDACATECCVNAESFFEFVQTMYILYSASTYRWQMLTISLPRGSLVVTSLSGTHWSARANVNKALFAHF